MPQALQECRKADLKFRIAGGGGQEDADAPRRLLCTRRKRPRSVTRSARRRRAANQPDDPAPGPVAHGVAPSACRPGRAVARRHSQSTALRSVSQAGWLVLGGILNRPESGTVVRSGHSRRGLGAIAAGDKRGQPKSESVKNDPWEGPVSQGRGNPEGTQGRKRPLTRGFNALFFGWI